MNERDREIAPGEGRADGDVSEREGDQAVPGERSMDVEEHPSGSPVHGQSEPEATAISDAEDPDTGDGEIVDTEVEQAAWTDAEPPQAEALAEEEPTSLGATSGWRRASRWLYPLGILVALGIGFGLGRSSVKQRVIFSGAMSGLEDRAFQGPADAPVTIVEYTDYDCPFCKRYHAQIYPALLQEYGDRVRYFVRHFPIQSLHPRAPNAARAAVCAEAQDRFWAYHELLFFRGNAPDDEGLVAYATELGLDGEQFTTCMDAPETRRAVLSDLQRGSAYGVRGTPAFFINGRVIFGAQPMEVFQQVVDAALAEAGEL